MALLKMMLDNIIALDKELGVNPPLVTVFIRRQDKSDDNFSDLDEFKGILIS